MKKALKNKRGNALLTAVMAFSVLLIVSVCIATLSVANINLSVKSKQNNNTYYVAQAAVQKGIQQVKDEVAQYYSQLLSYPPTSAGYADYQTANSNFFTAILQKVKDNYTKPTFTDSIYNGNTTIDMDFSIQDVSTDTKKFVVVSKATLTEGTAATTRTVCGEVNVKRIVVMQQIAGNAFDPFASAFKVGGNMVFNSGANTQQFTVADGVAEIGGYLNNNTTRTIIDSLGIKITPGLGNSIPNNLTYDTLLAKRSTQVTRYITASTPITWSDQTKSSSDPRYLEGVEGLSFTATQATIYGQIYCHGNLTLTGGQYYGNVFCDGSISMQNATVFGNLVAAGDITSSGGTYGGGPVNGSGDVFGFVYAGGSINLNNQGTTQNAIFYANKNININGNQGESAIMFAGGNIIDKAPNFKYSGIMIAKGNYEYNFTSSSWDQLNYSTSMATAAKQHPWYSTIFGSTSSSTKTTQLTPADLDNIVTNQKIYEK